MPVRRVVRTALHAPVEGREREPASNSDEAEGQESSANEADHGVSILNTARAPRTTPAAHPPNQCLWKTAQ